MFFFYEKVKVAMQSEKKKLSKIYFILIKLFTIIFLWRNFSLLSREGEGVWKTSQECKTALTFWCLFVFCFRLFCLWQMMEIIKMSAQFSHYVGFFSNVFFPNNLVDCILLHNKHYHYDDFEACLWYAKLGGC